MCGMSGRRPWGRTGHERRNPHIAPGPAVGLIEAVSNHLRGPIEILMMLRDRRKRLARMCWR